MNVNEYGIAFNLNVGFNLTGNTALTLVFTRPMGSTFTANKPDVSVGAAAISTTSGPFAANEYSVYVFKTGDLTEAGTYGVRLTYTDATKRLVSDPVTFTVNA